jgi:membrane protein required for colicin V production
MSWTWFDYGIVGLIALSALIGVMRGFLREVLSLIAWIVAIWVAMTFTEQVAGFFANVIEAPSMRLTAAFALLFLGTLLAAAIVNYVIVSVARKTGIGGTDRLLGLVFGVARGAVVVALIVLAAGLTPLPNDPWWRQSQLIGYFEGGAMWMREFLPKEVAKDIVLPSERPVTGTPQTPSTEMPAMPPGAAPGTAAPATPESPAGTTSETPATPGDRTSETPAAGTP